MEKEVMISLKGMQTNIENETNTMEFVSEGKFYKRDNTYYIVYKESELTGMEGTTTTIKISGDVVSLIRFGTVSSTLIFQMGQKNACNYGTEYGIIGISVEATDMRIDIDEDGGELYVEYDVELSGEKLGYNNFGIKVYPTKDAEID